MRVELKPHMQAVLLDFQTQLVLVEFQSDILMIELGQLSTIPKLIMLISFVVIPLYTLRIPENVGDGVNGGDR